ncbi:peptide chain release factor N(5)-glutamine methyltransferase [Hyphomonas sp.]|uniref:peptide chain release factor N(5)-glutamine methyltransferase n=1 Tax=Hyphomonas sp. TaxID=87 RepID=UPI00391A45A4
MSAPTFDDLIRTAARALAGAGIEDARQNAMLLMLAAFGDTRAALISSGPSPVPQGVQDAFGAALARRLAREPLQHILGHTGFYGLEILTDARALIPRPDSEVVVEQALALLPADRPAQLADLGTGSGCLLAAILSRRPLATGTGIEASPAAASLARENFGQLGLTARARVFEGRWSGWTGWGEVDLLISNPPYIPSRDIDTLEPEVRRFDPMDALDGGADGLDAYREIIGLGRTRLKPGVPLVFEIGHDQRASVQALLAAAGYSELGHRPDLGGNDRCVWGLAPDPSH